MQTLDDIRKAVKGTVPKPKATPEDSLAEIRASLKGASLKGGKAKDPGSVTDRLTRLESAMKLIVLPLAPMVPSSHAYAQMQLTKLLKELRAL